MPGGNPALLARMGERLLPILLVLVLLLALVAALACGPGAVERRREDSRPNLLLISMDTTRADHLSVYGYPRATSPNLAQLAKQGVRFDAAYAPSATTAPSHASLFTSLFPMDHRVIKNGRTLDGEFETVAEILNAEGFETAAVVSSYVLHGKFGLAQGFQSYDDDFSQASVPSGTTLWEGEAVEGKFYGSADDTTRRALAWLEEREHPERPFLFFVHYFDPHDPYLPPSGFEASFEPGPKEALKLNRTIFLYDLLLAFTDQEIGRLLAGLDRLGLGEDTVVIVTGDHGEGLMQHGHMHHGVHIYEEGVRVPLLVRAPGRIAPGREVAEPVHLVDVAPTLLELAGSSNRAAAFRGRSLAGQLLRDEPGEPDRPIYLYRRAYEAGEVAEGIYADGEKFGIRVGRWKLIKGVAEATMELFDLESDPFEKNDLSETQPERVSLLELRLEQWRLSNTREDKNASELSEADRARLEALGYVE